MARTTTTRNNSIVPMKGQPAFLHTASGGPHASHAPVTLFAPDGGSLYQVLVSLFRETLPDLYTLIEGHQQQPQGNGTGTLTSITTRRTTDPTQWRDSFTVQDDSNPFGTPETMSVDLCWYRDQFGHAGVNCQLFLTASADFPPFGWACVQAHRRGIAVLIHHNPEMAERYHNEQQHTASQR